MDEVLEKLAIYFCTPIEQIRKTEGVKRTRVRRYAEARWCWWLYLASLGDSYCTIAKLEGVNHATVKHAFTNKHLVLDDNVKHIIYGTDL